MHIRYYSNKLRRRVMEEEQKMAYLAFAIAVILIAAPIIYHTQ